MANKIDVTTDTRIAIPVILDLAARMVIWTRMAPPWARFDPALEHYEAQPPAPQSPATS